MIHAPGTRVRCEMTKWGGRPHWEYDAVVLARAGLARIGRLDAVTEVLDPLQMLPAPGQGALAVEARADDPLSLELAVLDDLHTRAAVTADLALRARARFSNC